jgi:hypothetical protein
LRQPSNLTGKKLQKKQQRPALKAYNAAAIAGFTEEACNAEQLAAFEAAING